MKPGQGPREAGSRESRVTVTGKHPRIRGRRADSQGAKGVAEALASGKGWQRLPSIGAVGGVQRPLHGAQVGQRGLGVGVRRVAHASLFSCFAVASGACSERLAATRSDGRCAGGRVVAGQPGSQAAGLERPAWGVRVREGPSPKPPRSRTECPPAARRAGSGQNVRGGEVGLPGAGAVSGSGDRMSLAQWPVHLPGSASPVLRVQSGVRCGGSPQIPLCKLASAPKGL